MKNNEKHISQKASEAFDAMTSHQPLLAPDDFSLKVEGRLHNTEVHEPFRFNEWLKYAALITIMLLNGVLLFSLLQQREAPSEDYDTVVDEYFPQYQTLSEELE